MDTISVAKYNCHYVCDVTDAATTQIKLLSKAESSNNPAICDVKDYWPPCMSKHSSIN